MALCQVKGTSEKQGENEDLGKTTNVSCSVVTLLQLTRSRKLLVVRRRTSTILFSN